MTRGPLLPLALIAAAASLTLHFDAVFAAGRVLAPVAADSGDPANSRVGAALSEDLSRTAAETARARALDLQAAMMQAAEKRIDGKLARLQSDAASERRQDGPAAASPHARLRSPTDRMAGLVKIYQAMRPKDAARILQRLDIAVQVDLASRMRERAIAAILAEMDSNAAGKLSMALAGGAAPGTADNNAL